MLLKINENLIINKEDIMIIEYLDKHIHFGINYDACIKIVMKNNNIFLIHYDLDKWLKEFKLKGNL